MKVIDTRDDLQREIILRVKRISDAATLAKIFEFVRSCTD